MAGGRRNRFFCDGISLFALGALLTQPAIAEINRPSAAQAARTFPFHIDAKPLLSALTEFTAVTRIQVIRPSAEFVRGQSSVVSGNLTASQALARLLAGTGLSYQFTSAGTVTIQSAAGEASNFYAQANAAVLETINVEGTGNPLSTMTPMPAYAGGQVASGGTVGMLGNRGVMDTPFNQTNYTQQTIQDQQARTVLDVLTNDPSVRSSYPSGGGLDHVYIRGFDVSNEDFSLNGLYGIAPSVTTSADFIERVEVLKGPSALLNGMPPGGGIGGNVNLVTKRAGDVPITRFTTSYASRSQFGEHVDIGRRFGPDNAFGIRFNGSYKNGELQKPKNKEQLGVAALGLDFRGDHIRLSADFGYQNDATDSQQQYAFFLPNVQVSPAPNANRNYMPSWTYLKTSDVFGMAQAEVDLTEHVTAYASIGAHNYRYKNLGMGVITMSSNGDFISYPFLYNMYTKQLTGQTGLRGSVDTGPVNHAFSFNAASLESLYGSAGSGGASFFGNLYEESYAPVPTIADIPARKSSHSRFSSVGVADTLSIFDKRIQVTVGVRRQQVGTDSFSPTGALTTGYSKGTWSPAYALVLKPWQNVSLYANYIEGLQRGTVVGASFANAGEVFPPYQSKQYEAGVKVDWNRLITTVSVFQISQPSAITVPGVPLNSYRLDGEQRNRGVELNTFGELTEGVRLLGGIMFLDGRQTKTENGANDGKKAVGGVPDVQLNLGAEWDTPFIPGFTLNGRMIYTSGQFVDPANTQRIPDWTRLDLGARYTFVGPLGKPVTIRLNVENVLDKSYWASSYNGYLSLSSPRTFLASTTMNF